MFMNILIYDAPNCPAETKETRKPLQITKKCQNIAEKNGGRGVNSLLLRKYADNIICKIC